MQQIKTFIIREDDYLKDDNIVNTWAEENKYKIDNISVCPYKWYMNDSNTRVEEIELLVSIIYHKRRVRKDKGDV